MALSAPQTDSGSDPWSDPYTGILKGANAVPPRPGDPDVHVWGAALVAGGPRASELAVGGASWSEAGARLACAGEGIERFQAYPLPTDLSLEASFAGWSEPEPALEPWRFVLFHPEQHALEGFPFAPLRETSALRWTPFRRVRTGDAVWVPEELAYLHGRPGAGHRFAPGLSTGFAAGAPGDPVLLRGLQEVIERDALMGAWWGRYPLEEWPADAVLASFGALRARVERPHLRYRFFRVETPFSRHVTIVSADGLEQEGRCFSVGASCREERRASWLKATLEAIQGRGYVRWLLGDGVRPPSRAPADLRGARRLLQLLPG